MHEDSDPKHARQTGHYRVSGQPRGVLFPNVPSTKKRWPTEASNQHKTVELLSNNRALQNGRHSYAKRPAKSRRLDGKDRTEGCILYGIYPWSRRTENSFASNGKTRRTSSTVYRLVVISSLGLYQDHKTSCCNSTRAWTLPNYLHRQFCDSRDRVNVKRPHYGSDFPAGKFGVVIDQPKSQLMPTKEIEFLGSASTPLRWSRSYQARKKRGRQYPAVTDSHSTHAVQIHREDEFSHSGHSHDPTLLREPPVLPLRGSAGILGLHFCGDTNRKVPGRNWSGGKTTSLSGMVGV